MSVKLKEFILEELASDKGLKERYDVLLEKRFGAMARFFHAIAEETQDEIIRAILPQDMKQLEGNQFLLENFEGFIRFDLLKKARKKFPGQFSDDEFEITYLEAKEDYIALRKKKEMKAAAKQREAPLKLPEPKKPEGEKAEYVIFLSRPSGIGVIREEEKEESIHKEYLEKKKNYDIFIYEQTVYRKVTDEAKDNMAIISLDRNILNLLVLFLKYKNTRIPYEKLYGKAWEGSINIESEAARKMDARVMNRLKTAVNELKNEFEYLKGFSIPHARARGYICEGDFKFCVVLKKSTEDWYTLEGV